LKNKLNDSLKTIKEYKIIVHKFNVIRDIYLMREIEKFYYFVKAGNSGTFSNADYKVDPVEIVSWMIEELSISYDSFAIKDKSRRNNLWIFMENHPVYVNISKYGKEDYIDYNKICKNNINEVIYNKKEYINPF
jgi:hypothetical protein